MNDEESTSEKIMIERVGDTFEMTLKAKKMEYGARKELKWAEDGGKRYDASDEDEDMLKEMAGGKSGSAVFSSKM